MDTENVWEKIRKTVVDGVNMAAEKTEEYTRMGKAKLDVLAVKRKMTKLHTDLGAHIYQVAKDGNPEGVFESDPVKNMVNELRDLETELVQKDQVYQELRNRAQTDVEEVKKKAKSGIEEIKTKTKARVNRMKKKAEGETGENPETSEPGKDIPVE
jgi:hypothetical protein